MSATITNDVLEISSGVVSTGLAFGTGAEVFVMNGGTLAESLVTDTAYVWVDAGGSIQKVSATNAGNIFLEGSATELQLQDNGQVDIYAGGKLTSAYLWEKGYGAVYADGSAEKVTVSSGGSLLLNGGVAEQTVVWDKGAFTVQEVTALAKNTTVLNGGSMYVTNAAAVHGTTVNGGGLQILSGTADGIILDGGSVAVKDGNTIQNTTVKDGTLELSSTAATGTIVSGGQVKAVSTCTFHDVTMTGGQLTAEGGSVKKISVGLGAVFSATATELQDVTVTGGQVAAASAKLTGAEITAGTASLTGMTIDGLTVDAGASATLDNTSIIVGKAAFATGSTVGIDGATVAFSTAVATSTEAQIKGLSVAVGDAVYTLTAEPEVGVYLLADGVECFNIDVTFGEYTLNLDAEPVKIGELVYSLNLNGGVLSLSIEEYVPPVPGVVTLAYANSEWVSLEPGSEVMVGSIPAVIGLNAFATGDAATAAVADVEEGKVCVAGGTVKFASGVTKNTTVYSGAVIANPDVTMTGSLTLNKGATLVGKATFAEGSNITINGTVAFDTAYATADSAQITVHCVPEGKASFTLNVAENKIGTYQLLAGLSTFEDEVAFGSYTLSVGAAPVTIDGLDYALSMDSDNVLTLSITEYVPPLDNTPPTVTNVKASTMAPTNQNVIVTADFQDDVELASSLFKHGEAGEWTAYVSGVTVSENEIVYLKAVDAAGNESEIVGCTVSNIDKVPPVAPSASADITTPTDQDVTVTAVFSEDSVTKEYSFDGTAWSPYVAPIKFTTNDSVYFRGTDAAGNVSEVTGYTVSNIDKTTPDTVPPTVKNIMANTMDPTNQDVVVTADFADDVQLASSQYKIGDAAEWTPYVSGATVSENGIVYFRAVDAAGNESEIVGYTVSNIDKVAPTIADIAPNTTEPAESVTVTAVFADDVALASSQYKIGEAGNWYAYVDGVTVTDNLTIYFQATDTAGNETIESYTVTNVLTPEQDDTPPIVLNVKADITTPTDQDVTVTAEFTDNVAVASSLYKINDGAWKDYPVDGVTLSENAVVSFKAVDTSGNESEIVGYTVSNIEKTGQDTEAPTLLYIKANITKPTNKDVTVTAEFEDNVGVTSMLYKIGDAGEWQTYVDGVVVSENATVVIKAADAAGNSTEATYKVANIDKTLPDGQAQVYVNPDWAGLASGTSVKTYDTSFATVGVNAFATGDEANDAVDPDGHISLEGGTITFTEAAQNVTLHSENGVELVADNEAGLDSVWVYPGGTITMTKGVMTNCKVLDGHVTVESGAIVDGLTVDAPYGISVAVNGGTARNVAVGCLQSFLDMTYPVSMSVAGKGGLLQIASVTSGGNLDVSSGAKAETVSVSNGGYMVVTGASAENVTLTGSIPDQEPGRLVVGKGGSVSGLTVSSGGSADAQNGAVLNDLNIQAGGVAHLSGEATSGSKAVVSGSGFWEAYLEIESGAVFTGATIGERGAMRIWNDSYYGFGIAYDTVLQKGGVMQNSGYASNTEVQDGGWLEVSENGLAENTTVKQGGSASISGHLSSSTADPTVEYGIAAGLTVENGGIVTVEDYGMLSGRVTIADGANVTMTGKSTLDFNISGLTGTETTPLVRGYSLISGTPALTLSVSMDQAAGTYLLADGLSSFDRVIALGEYELTVGGEPVTIEDITYSLGFADGVLSLTVGSEVEVINGPDKSGNNALWDQKTKTPNMAIFTSKPLVIDGDTTAVYIDEKGSVSVERADGITYNNFVGKITGQGFDPDTDPADYRKIELKTGARLSFSVTAQASGKFVIYQITENWNEKKQTLTYTKKAVQTTNLSVKKNAANVAVDTKAVYLEAGTYFLAMETKIDKKKDTEGFYNVEMHYVDPAEDKKNQSTKFYTDDDDGSNNWVYDKKDKENPVNPAVYGSDPFIINADTNHVQVDKAGTVYYEDEYGFTWENFVGFGDDTDFVRIDLDAPSELSFNVQATGAAKMTIYCLETGVDKNEEPTYKLKAIQTTTLKKQKFEIADEEGGIETFEMYTASTKPLLLDRPADNQQYFIAVQSTNAKKGDEAYYNVTLGEIGEAVNFFTDSDNGWNNYVYDKKLGFNEEYYDSLVPTEFMEETTVVMLDSAPVGEDWNNFVGFGDATDYAKIEVTAGMTLNFSLSATDAAKFTIWSLEVGKDKYGETTYKMNSLQSTTLKKDKETGLYAADTKDYTFKEGGTYFISMESSNAKKGSETYYNVVGNRTSFSEASALDMPELSGGLGGFDTGDVLASAGSASGLDDFAELDDKSAWRSIASLA